MRGLIPAPWLSLSLLALWLILNGSVHPGTVALGIAVALMVPLMTQSLRPTRCASAGPAPCCD